MLYIYGLYGARKGVLYAIVYIKAYTFTCGGFKLCITAIHVFKVPDFDCVYKLYTFSIWRQQACGGGCEVVYINLYTFCTALLLSCVY